jgi:hypothetical protein
VLASGAHRGWRPAAQAYRGRLALRRPAGILRAWEDFDAMLVLTEKSLLKLRHALSEEWRSIFQRWAVSPAVWM